MRQNHPPAEPATYEDWYAEHAPFVLRLARWFGVPLKEREDVAQEVWCDVHRSLHFYDPAKGSARAWLGGITKNKVRDWKRARRRRPEFSALLDRVPDLPATQDAPDAGRARQREAITAFLEHAIPNEDRRTAWVLHVVEGLTLEEVAQVTGARFWTVQWRIRVARQEMERAKNGLTEEERDRMRAVILPLGSVDAIARALRDAQPPVTDDEIARVWDRVVERIEAEGGSIHDTIGTQAQPPTSPAPKLYTLTGPGLAGALGGMLLVGAVTGAAALYAFLSRDHQPSMTAIDAEIPPAPTATAEPQPAPAPTASAAPSASSSPASGPGMSETWILDRAKKAEPADALRLADLHAQRFPGSRRADQREEIAIRALVKLGDRAKAEERAAKLVRWAPWMAPVMEALLGRSFL